LAWLGMQTGDPKTTFLVHGEEGVMQKFTKHLGATKLKISVLRNYYEL